MEGSPLLLYRTLTLELSFLYVLTEVFATTVSHGELDNELIRKSGSEKSPTLVTGLGFCCTGLGLRTLGTSFLSLLPPLGLSHLFGWLHLLYEAV